MHTYLPTRLYLPGRRVVSSFCTSRFSMYIQLLWPRLVRQLSRIPLIVGKIETLGQGVCVGIYLPGYICQVAELSRHFVSVDSACISNYSGSDW